MESFVLLPILTVSMPYGNLLNTQKTDIDTTPQIALSIQQNMQANSLLAYNQAMDAKAKILQTKADAIDAYFLAHNMPLAGTGLKMVQEAEKNDLDYRLIPAIAVRESTGGRHACVKVKNNPFGWGSCKIGFKSYGEAIETLARNLGGNNPTTQHHYSGKTTKEILQKYNPPSIAPKYVPQVLSIMDSIGKENPANEVATIANS